MQDRLAFPDGTCITGYGHYTESYVRQAGTWKIARSKLSRLHVDVTPPVA